MSNVIYPPPDIRKLADSTAKFTAKNDKALEDRIRENKKGNIKFSFLNPGDPYYNYYIAEKQKVRLGIQSEPVVESETVTVVPEVAPVVEDIPNPPAPFYFQLEPPPIPQQDLDVIKLTALYIAKNGVQFRSGLIQRERGNYQFDFLRPGHALFPYFSQLCDQYATVLNPNQDILELLDVVKDSKFKIMQRVMERVRYSIYQQEESKKEAEREDKERAAFASIDWHDFVIVQTLEFTSFDKKSDLPGPESIESIISASQAAKKAAEMSKGLQEMEALDIENKNTNENIQKIQNNIENNELPTPPPTFNNPTTNVPTMSTNNVPIKIRRDYVPKIGVNRNNGEDTQVCPICNLKIPKSEIDEHIRIEKLDPKWKAQKEINEARNRDSNLLRDTTDVSNNLKKLAGYRSDLFGSDEIGIGKKLEEDVERRKLAEKDKVKYDGFTTINNNNSNNFPPPPNNMAPPSNNLPPPFLAICPPYIPPPGGPQHPPIHPPQDVSAPPQRPPFQQTQVPPFIPPNRFQPPPFIPPPTHTLPPPTVEAKKPKLEGVLANLTPEHQFIEMNPDPVTVNINVPKDESKPEWQLNGQTIQLEGLKPETTMQEIKEQIFSKLQFPANKQKLTVTLPIKAPPQVAKNNYTLATYNLTGEVTIALSIKERGGKK
ncbi:hypothetical protein K502DRAFT_324804 [Neoconidiobolus thromboides FSU 785]|nr:hypothetical protein K502DRAFT_324804 [Neoconidiobolus thromboides FSU 785]